MDPQSFPFTQAQFFDLFERYNHAIWPAQIVAYVLGIGVVGAIIAAAKWSTPVVLASLAALWVWTGIGYHLAFFAEINPAANLFGALFLAQAFVLMISVGRKEIRFRPRGSFHVVAWSMIVYASAIYPLLNAWMGHAYPSAPTFGVTPCPLVIFTLGVLLLTQTRTPWFTLATPIIWAAIGGTAAVWLGVAADWMLPAAGALAILVNARKPAVFESHSAGAGAGEPSQASSSRSASRCTRR